MDSATWQIVGDSLAVAFAALSVLVSMKMYQLVKCRMLEWLIVTTVFGLVMRSIMLVDSADGARNWGWTMPVLALLWIIVVVGMLMLYSVLKKVVKGHGNIARLADEVRDAL